MCSPEEAYEVFQSHKVSEAQFAEQGPLLISKAGLMCRLGDRVYPWQEAAPVVMGVLAFGGDWHHFLPAEGGLPVAVPSVEAQHPQQDARKVSHRYICLFRASKGCASKLAGLTAMSALSSLSRLILV